MYLNKTKIYKKNQTVIIHTWVIAGNVYINDSTHSTLPKQSSVLSSKPSRGVHPAKNPLITWLNGEGSYEFICNENKSVRVVRIKLTAAVGLRVLQPIDCGPDGSRIEFPIDISVRNSIYLFSAREALIRTFVFRAETKKLALFVARR